MLDLNIIRQHLVVDHYEDDELLAAYEAAAIQYCEGKIAAPIKPAERARYFDAFENAMPLGRDVISVDAVTYHDTDGVEQVLDPAVYTLGKGNSSDYLLLVTGQHWPPGTRVTVTYTAGLATLPADIEQAILLAIGHFYANREGSTPMAANDMPHGIDALLRPHTVRFVG